MHKRFKLIACINTSLSLGKNNELLYHIKEDLKSFRRITIDNVVVMGLNTYLSLPNKSLKDRIMVVITSHAEQVVNADGKSIIVVPSIQEALNLCESKYSSKEWFIIGGAQLYKSVLDLDLVDTMYLTEVDDDVVGDVFFPPLNYDIWNKNQESQMLYDELNDVKYKFTIYLHK